MLQRRKAQFGVLSLRARCRPCGAVGLATFSRKVSSLDLGLDNVFKEDELEEEHAVLSRTEGGRWAEIRFWGSLG